MPKKKKTIRKTIKNPLRDFYRGKKVLITGGMGFIGSNLTIALVGLGAEVLIVDSMIEGYGGNFFNIEPVKNKVRVNLCDITDKNAMEWLVRDQDIIFHLAGQVSHIMSYTDPYKDIDYNITGTAILLEACRKYNPGVKIVYTGTRGQYGPAMTLPVNETASTNPKGLFEVTNLAAEQMLLVYHSTHGIKSILTRLTNIYGPRGQMKSNKYLVANWFKRLALDNEVIPIFGDGKIMRDFLYVDDAIEALLVLPIHDHTYGEIYNVGNSRVSNFKELAEVIVKIAGTGKIEHTPFSLERKKQEPGHFYSDISKISSHIGWKPKVELEEGVKQTIDFYKKHKKHYW